MANSKIIASGAYLPQKVLLNEDLSKFVDTSDEWIFSRTGIKKRHIVADNQATSDLAVNALQDALITSGIQANSLDGIIVATTTPDIIFPSTAALVQNKLNLTNGAFAFDINAVCTGFVYALSVADSLLKNGTCKRVAVIGAETMSRILDWKDRTTCVLFGDGAGAFILELDSSNSKSGIIASELHADGSYESVLKVGCGISTGDLSAKLYMNGREVYKHAVEKMATVAQSLVNQSGLTMADVDWLLLHQANLRMIDAIAEKLVIAEDKVIKTIEEHANTSAASIPLAFNTYYKQGKLKQGNLVLIAAAGAGLTWGGALLRI